MLITALILIATASIGKSQDKLIGRDTAYINSIMASENHLITGQGNAEAAGQAYITYKMMAGYSMTFYFDKVTGECIGLKEFLTKELLEASIINLNKRYVKIDANHWISNDNNYKVVLGISDDTIILTHTKI